MLNEYLSKVFLSFSNLIKRFLASFIKDKKMVKIHRFEPRLTKKNAKIGFKQKRSETIISFGIKPMNSILALITVLNTILNTPKRFFEYPKLFFEYPY